MASMDFQRRMRADPRAIVLLSACVVALACDAGSSTSQSPTTTLAPSPTATPERATAPSAPLASSTQPPAATTHEPTFVLLLHGLGGSGRNITRHFAIDSLAASLGFDFEAPDGTVDRQGRRFWNAGPGCCDFDGLAPDHVSALGAVLARERAKGKRVFVVGYSNGGFMAHRLACEVEGISGILSVAGPSPMDVATCKHAAARVLHVHGDADPIVRFEGGGLFGNERKHASAEYSVLGWAKRRGCDAPLETIAELDLDEAIEGGETLVQSPPCAPELQLHRVRGGTHSVINGRASIERLMRSLLE